MDLTALLCKDDEVMMPKNWRNPMEWLIYKTDRGKWISMLMVFYGRHNSGTTMSARYVRSQRGSP
jgi:hypothetical protein